MREDEEKQKHQELMMEVMDQEMKKIEDQREEARRDAQQLESQLLLSRR